MSYYIEKEFAKQILFIGVSPNTPGGMASVIISYHEHIEGIRFIPTWKLGHNIIKLYYFIQAVIRTVISLTIHPEIKIVHIHGAAYSSFERCKLFIYLSKKFKKKVILHQHAGEFEIYYRNSKNKKTITTTLQKCDKLIVLSQSWKEFYASIGVEKERIKVLYNPVTLPLSVQNKKRSKKLHFLFLGTICKGKGIFDLLEVLSESPEYYQKHIQLRIGGNEIEGDIQEEIHRKQLDNFVSYEGWISGQKKIEAQLWADIYILPSYAEGLPVAILEAMSYQHPIISTTVGGIPEIIQTGKNGLLISPGNKKAIEEAIKFYIENPQEINKQGRESYRIVKDFSSKKVFEELRKIYQEF